MKDKKPNTNISLSESDDFLFELSFEYKKINALLEMNLEEVVYEREIRKSSKHIQSLIEKSVNRYKDPMWINTYEVIDNVNALLDQFHIFNVQIIPLVVLDFVISTIHALMDLLEIDRDSDGYIESTISKALSVVIEIADNEKLTQSEKSSIYDKLLQEIFSARDNVDEALCRLNRISDCSEFAGNPVFYDKFETQMIALVEKETMSEGSPYVVEKINLIRYQTIALYVGQKEAEEFVQKNIQSPPFRKIAIEKALLNNGYDTVIKLALEGEKHDKDYSGQVWKWREYRYRALKAEGKLDEQRKILEKLLLDGNFEYYFEYKQTYDQDEWIDVYPKLLTMIKSQTNCELYTRILVEEKDRQGLLAYVKENPSTVKTYYELLIPYFKEELCEILVQYILKAASTADDRNAYQSLCSIIKILQKVGGTEKANSVKQELLDRNSITPVFLDELSKV